MRYPPLDSTPACDGTLTIDDLPMHTAAWTLPDLSQLYGTPDKKGGDRSIPGVAGVRPYRRRPTVTRLSLPLLVTGWYQGDGTENVDPNNGLVSNMAFLQLAICADPGSTAGTRTCVWTKPDGATVTAAVHVLGIPAPVRTVGWLIKGTLELSVPGGDLHV